MSEDQSAGNEATSNSLSGISFTTLSTENQLLPEPPCSCATPREGDVLALSLMFFSKSVTIISCPSVTLTFNCLDCRFVH